MLTLLGSLLGFLGSFAPEILKFFTAKEDRFHELQILDRQMEIIKLNHHNRVEEIRNVGEVEAIRRLYTYPKVIGIRWIDVLSGTVRPLVTYAFLILYLGVKIVHLREMVCEGHIQMWGTLLAQGWHEEDQALFAAVISFWFGQRSLMKRKR
jgi:hypothetical protein